MTDTTQPPTPADLAAWRAIHVIPPHTVAKMAAVENDCDCSQNVVVRDLARSHENLRAEYTRLLDEVERLREENARLGSILDGNDTHQQCGICGKWFPYEQLHYGTLGDDVGWVCEECEAEALREEVEP